MAGPARKPAAKLAPADKAARKPAEGVAAVERALSIVATLETSDRPMTLAELAGRTRLYKSTILRLLGSLVGMGYVARLRDGAYDLGPTVYSLGMAFSRRNWLGSRGTHFRKSD